MGELKTSATDIIANYSAGLVRLHGRIPNLLLPVTTDPSFPRPQDLFKISSATLSLFPLVSAASGFTSGPPMLSAMASAAAFLSRSASSVFTPARSFVSFSSSLSPRLNGSLSPSPTGLGSTVDSGCHLLCLPGVGALSPAPDFGLLISSGGPPWNDTFRPSPDLGVAGVGLKRSGLASGRVERRGGSSNPLDLACRL